MKSEINPIGKHTLDKFRYVVDINTIDQLVGGNLYSNCQEKIDNEILGVEHWIKLSKVFQNIVGKNIATILGKIEADEVVIKVQSNENSQREFKINKKLDKLGLVGFAEFYCFFTCGEVNLTKFGDDIKAMSICEKSGDNYGIILQRYYSGGSLCDYLKYNLETKNDLNLILDILIEILINIFRSYIEYNFIHGDLFPKNIVLDSQGTPYIIDFELSKFEENDRLFWRDIGDLFDHLTSQSSKMKNFDDYISRFVLLKRATNQKPSLEILEEFVSMIKIYQKN